MLNFVDAHEMHRKHPATFHIPDASDLALVAPGWFVKVSLEGERFWVEVKQVVVYQGNRRFVGAVNNDLVVIDPEVLHDGSKVEVEDRHVHAVLPPAPTMETH